MVNGEDNICAFEVASKERSYQFIAESESDKRIWIEEIHSAVFSILVRSAKPYGIGWMHETYTSTIHAACYFGNIDLLNYHIKRLNGESVDIPDDSGMCPIHWYV